jgi:epsilon-lactone hydrolase
MSVKCSITDKSVPGVSLEGEKAKYIPVAAVTGISSGAGGERRLLSSGAAGPSWQSRCLNGLLRLLPFKQRWASAAVVQERVRRLALRPASYEPAGLGRGVEVTLKNVAGWPVYYTAPSANPRAGNYVLFLHGGGYINEIVRAHWRFVAYLTRHARVRCVVPIFPLAPRATAKEVVPAMGDLLRKLLEDAGSAKVTVVGNSAGAGLGLAAAQWLRDSGSRQPNALALISPVLDASISRPEQREIAARDPLLDIPGLIEAGRLYAGDLDVAHPYVSPLNGDFSGLAPMIVFSGTLDLLYPDSIDLAAKAQAAGVPIELHLQKGQPHNYAGMPTPEGREARAIILRVVVQD